VRNLIVICGIAVAAVKFNETLKELFVADNKLTPSDGVQLGSLMKTNHTLALLDLRNNLLQVSAEVKGCLSEFASNRDLKNKWSNNFNKRPHSR